LRRSSAAALVRRNRSAQLGFLVVSFWVATLIAKAFGAGWGTAATFGQIAFVSTVFVVLMTDEPPRR
jgi:uncharacterized membrane protein